MADRLLRISAGAGALLVSIALSSAWCQVVGVSILHAMATAQAANTTSCSSKKNVLGKSPPSAADAHSPSHSAHESPAYPLGASNIQGVSGECGGKWTYSAVARLPMLCQHCADKPANMRASRRARKAAVMCYGKGGLWCEFR